MVRTMDSGQGTHPCPAQQHRLAHQRVFQFANHPDAHNFSGRRAEARAAAYVGAVGDSDSLYEVAQRMVCRGQIPTCLLPVAFSVHPVFKVFRAAYH